METTNPDYKMTHISRIACIVVTLAFTFAISSCDPTKTGGGGLPQSYNSINGQYN